MVGRKVDVTQLVGTAEIAERLGLSGLSGYTTVHKWRTRYPDFPEPVAEVSSVLVWDWREVEKWARKTGRVANE